MRELLDYLQVIDRHFLNHTDADVTRLTGNEFCPFLVQIPRLHRVSNVGHLIKRGFPSKRKCESEGEGGGGGGVPSIPIGVVSNV